MLPMQDKVLEAGYGDLRTSGAGIALLLKLLEIGFGYVVGFEVGKFWAPTKDTHKDALRKIPVVGHT